jgi:TRAP-type C4-dicarboxylate transport system permease small subunit
MKLLQLLDDHLEEAVIFVAFSIMSIVITLQVFMRYAMQASLSWSEELARYLFIWLIYIGISYGVKKNAHVAVTATDLVLSETWRKWIKIISNLVFLAFAACAFYYGREVCATIARLGQQTPAMDIPMWLVYAAVPTGFCLTAIRLVQSLCRQWRDLNKPAA